MATSEQNEQKKSLMKINMMTINDTKKIDKKKLREYESSKANIKCTNIIKSLLITDNLKVNNK